MARWEPGTRERLQGVALQLFAERGYDETTVAQIAQRAEVTERTFYRYFGDKREVIFDGQHQLEDAFAAGVADAPDGTPTALAEAGLARSADFFAEERRPWSRSRAAVIEADAALRERELLKMAHLATVLTDALRARGIPDPQAGLAADSALSVFRLAFSAWVSADETRTFAELIAAMLAELRALARG